MQDRFEFRMPDGHAREVFGASAEAFRLLSGETRVVRVQGETEAFAALDSAYQTWSSTRPPLFYSWDVRRSYTATELGASELVRVLPVGAFEPIGEDCGTRYDESTACRVCGTGRAQLSPLSLDVPSRGPDVARSMADEVVVSDRVRAWFDQLGGTGARFDPVLRCKTQDVLEGWFQLVATSPPVEVIVPTRYGIDPFDRDPTGRDRCPEGHRPGLNLVSELTVDRGSWNGADLVITRQHAGERRGDLVPAPEYLVSNRVYQAMRTNRARGVRFEVVHLR